jgi:hypothetical protein
MTTMVFASNAKPSHPMRTVRTSISAPPAETQALINPWWLLGLPWLHPNDTLT